MPELPEVETIRLGLQKYLVGYSIAAVEVRLPRILSGDISHIIGATIIGIKRFGKGLVIELNNGYSIAIHIKMTGQIVFRGSETEGLPISKAKIGELPNAWTHLIFKLKRQNSNLKSYLYYNDIRQFGWIKIIRSDELKSLAFFRDLGPEPFKDLTFEVFDKILSSAKTKIKPLLMDQAKIAGIGNIYANDSLFLAKIHPTRPANSLSKEEKHALFTSIEKVLRKGLEVGGASEYTYVNALGQEGGYQKHFQVYGKEGKPCIVCGTKIHKITLGGRGTFICETCQK